uniref:Uncharacterized protein n=1 Tax=Triticum urartu TaxID=4572 RepID=A0A8R7UZX1_TRIUA
AAKPARARVVRGCSLQAARRPARCHLLFIDAILVRRTRFQGYRTRKGVLPRPTRLAMSAIEDVLMGGSDQPII